MKSLDLKQKVMKTKILKGTELQEKVFLEVRKEIITLNKESKQIPGIAFIGFLGVYRNKTGKCNGTRTV
jgi:hypothetical protein